jgi:hypothetical protein
MSRQEIPGFTMDIWVILSRDAKAGLSLEPWRGETLFHSPEEAQKAARQIRIRTPNLVEVHRARLVVD